MSPLYSPFFIFSNLSQQIVTLSFLALPVIPELKLTDQGLFHVPTFSRIPIEKERSLLI
ncbi:adenine deaminase C-terminal domain-containing protein [Bacillus sp. CECT 9360]|uniref:adenine deaminase C-terminal domain-containing protein n=1 Tax=Bacillus sp. CECT 9360 TaxID=2845821 RepID=UPI0025B6849E|nr:adenine deaminase C-terminal domain-containing protein [Bacillus sp. CECT 9360]